MATDEKKQYIHLSEFSQMRSSDKKKILRKVAKEANRMQRELVNGNTT